MKKYLRLTWILFKNAYIRDSQISGFVVSQVAWQFIDTFVTIIFFDILFAGDRKIAGWNFYETLFLYAFAYFVYSIHNTWTKRGTRSIAGELIRVGDLDLYLTKPIEPMYFISISRPKVYEICGSIFAFCLGIYAVVAGQLPVTLESAFWLFFLMIISIILYYYLQIITIIPAFWLVRFWSLQYLMGRLNQFMYYPANVFPRILRLIFMLIFPVLAVTYIPVNNFLHPPQTIWIFYLIFITIVFGFVTRALWRLAVRSYSSASS